MYIIDHMNTVQQKQEMKKKRRRRKMWEIESLIYVSMRGRPMSFLIFQMATRHLTDWPSLKKIVSFHGEKCFYLHCQLTK